MDTHMPLVSGIVFICLMGLWLFHIYMDQRKFIRMEQDVERIRRDVDALKGKPDGSR